MQDKIKFLIDYLEQRGVEIVMEDVSNVELIDGGFIDSFGMLTLLMTIEDEFNIKITPDDMLNDANKSLLGLAKLIDKKER